MRLLLALSLVLAMPLGAQQLSTQSFTDSQALRGRRWFEGTCLHCHAAKEMASPDFKVRWGGRTALDLFLRISSTMPEDSPGSLSTRSYTDIVAYLMQINGIVAGVQPLTADSTVLAAARLGFDSTSSAPR